VNVEGPSHDHARQPGQHAHHADLYLVQQKMQIRKGVPQLDHARQPSRHALETDLYLVPQQMQVIMNFIKNSAINHVINKVMGQ
jgi:hypothetical protein